MYFNDSCLDQYDWVIGTNLRYKSYAGLKGVTKFGIVIEPGIGYGSVHGSTAIAQDLVKHLFDLKNLNSNNSNNPYQRIGLDGKIYYDHTECINHSRFYKINDTFILYKHPQFNLKLNMIDNNLPCNPK